MSWYTAAMGIFGKKNARKGKSFRSLLAGFVIGGAVASIVGKKVLDESHEEHAKEEKDDGKKE